MGKREFKNVLREYGITFDGHMIGLIRINTEKLKKLREQDPFIYD